MWLDLVALGGVSPGRLGVTQKMDDFYGEDAHRRASRVAAERAHRHVSAEGRARQRANFAAFMDRAGLGEKHELTPSDETGAS